MTANAIINRAQERAWHAGGLSVLWIVVKSITHDLLTVIGALEARVAALEAQTRPLDLRGRPVG